MDLPLHPIMRNGGYIGMAHEVLQQCVKTMARMCLMQVIRLAAGKDVAVVVVEEDLLSQSVEAVDLVEDVNLGDVGIGTEAVVHGVFGRNGRVLAEAEDVGAGDGDSVDKGDAVPGSIDKGGRIIAVDGVGLVDE